MYNFEDKTFYITDKLNKSNQHIYQEYNSIILALLNSKEKLKDLWIIEIDSELVNNRDIYSNFIHKIILNNNEYLKFTTMNIYKKNEYLKIKTERD